MTRKPCRRGPHQRFSPMSLNAADPFLALPARVPYTFGRTPIQQEEPMVARKLQTKRKAICFDSPRRPQHRSYPGRLPGQKSTTNLHRTSPTSLLPLREKLHRRQHLHSSRCESVLFAAGPCQSGQAWMAMLRKGKVDQTKRRDLMHQYNKRTANGTWRGMVGKWHFHDWVITSFKPYWLHTTQPEEECEVEGLLPAADVDGEVDLKAVGTFLGNHTVIVSPQKRSSPTETGYGEEVSVRWARRNELRLREEVRPHVDRVQACRAPSILAEQRSRQERADAANRRIMAERSRREEEEHWVAEEQLLRIVEDSPFLESTSPNSPASSSSESLAISPELSQVDSPAGPSRETSGSPAPSEPPEYEFPFYPVIMPVPAHLRPRPAAFQAAPTLPPTYIRNLRYRSVSPSPPPPYNASTDRETLVAPIFVEDDPEEEAFLSRIRPSGLFRTPSPERSIVGAFPEVPAPPPPVPARSHRSAWEAALDLEEGEEDLVEGNFEDERDVTQEVPVFGPIGRLLGRVWRW